MSRFTVGHHTTQPQNETRIIKHAKVERTTTVTRPKEEPSIQTPQPVEKELVQEGEVEVVQRRRKGATQAASDIVQENITGDVGLGKRKQEVEEQQPNKGDSEADEEEEDEESEGDEVEMPRATKSLLTRPVFIGSQLRDNTFLSDIQEAQQREEKVRIQSSLTNKTLQSMAETQQTTEHLPDELSPGEEGLPPESDDDEEVAYAKWKVRELARIKRDREERTRVFRQKEAAERRRLMTDEERALEDKKIGKYKENQKSHYRFMQKHYSVGIYNIDENDPLFQRDYNVAVGEDLFDKTALPGVKQVRRGEEHKKGKSKYTHLVAEDTTNFDPFWLPADDLVNKQKNMTAGYKNAAQFERPGLRKNH